MLLECDVFMFSLHSSVCELIAYKVWPAYDNSLVVNFCMKVSVKKGLSCTLHPFLKASSKVGAILNNRVVQNFYIIFSTVFLMIFG